MYALIYKAGSFLGVFSSKAKMRAVIETMIKDNYECSGTYGNFNFRWVKFNIDEPWFTVGDKEPSNESRAILSLFTLHTENFTHNVMTDWSTGKILSLDADNTTNI